MVGAVEYNDCTSAERSDKQQTTNECPGYDTKPGGIVRLKSWSFEKYRVLLHCNSSQVHPDSDW